MFLLLGDHAGNLVPKRLHGLGLDGRDLDRHIALDRGVSELGRRLSRMLDAPFVEQRYSRLVIDCNREARSEASIVEVSDGTRIAGNCGLSRADTEQRIGEIFHPYHRAIADLLAERATVARPTILVSLHSFTPELDGIPRPWTVGVLHSGGDTRFARAMLQALEEVGGLAVGDNEPYRMDETDFTVPRHAFAAGLPYAELEIRQDEIADEAGLRRMAGVIEAAMTIAKGACDP